MTDDTGSRGSSLVEENIRLQRAVDELSILNDIATAINSTMSLDKIVDLIVQKCIKHLKVEQAAVMLLDDQKAEKSFHTMIRRADHSTIGLPYHLNTHLTGWMLKNKKPLLANDFLHDERFVGVGAEAGNIRSLLSVPLFLKGRMIGLVACFNKKTDEGFNPGDERLLYIIACQSSQIIENARLHEDEEALRSMQEEFRLASKIQMGLLPKAPPAISGYDIAGCSLPAQIVGGDYFDFITADENRFVVCVGDISGKGLPAAMLMSNLQAIIRAQTLLNMSPEDCLARSNQLLYCNTEPDQFATLFYGILDPKTHRFCCANAGHNRPILFRPGEQARILDMAGIALGFIEQTHYDNQVADFRPGDWLVIYSDGITEAMNRRGDEFGEKRLEAILRDCSCPTSDTLMKTIVREVKAHAKDCPQSDDMTLVVIRRKIDPS